MIASFHIGPLDHRGGVGTRHLAFLPYFYQRKNSKVRDRLLTCLPVLGHRTCHSLQTYGHLACQSLEAGIVRLLYWSALFLSVPAGAVALLTHWPSFSHVLSRGRVVRLPGR